MTKDEIPTEPMFDAEQYRKQRPKKGSVKSVAQGKCPHCLSPRTGVIRYGTHLVWRKHFYITWMGARFDCLASGMYVCVAPEVQPLNPSAPLHCRHS